jgi:hypothetical protein
MEEKKHDYFDEGSRLRQAINKMFNERAKYLKEGLDKAKSKDIGGTMRCYQTYLIVVAARYNVEEPDLTPELLKDVDPSEIFLLSQVYWFFVKVYAKSPSNQELFKKYLDKFVLFSYDFRHQYVNSEVLRRYFLNRGSRNYKLFLQAYKKLRGKGPNCFIVTFCYSDESSITAEFRSFRARLCAHPIGFRLVQLYYLWSPKFILLILYHPRVGHLVTRYLLRPILYTIYRLLWFKSSIKVREGPR